MSFDDSVSRDRIHAFVDGQLDETGCAELRDAMSDDPALDREVRHLRDINDLAAQAYHACYPATAAPSLLRSGSRWRPLPVQAVAATVLLLLGALIGAALVTGAHGDRTGASEPPGIAQAGSTPGSTPASVQIAIPSIRNLDQINPAATQATRILLHINTMDPKRVDAALDATENILAADVKKGRAVQVEVVANEAGLGILRKGSPYEARIHALLSKYNNLSFKACGIAMQTAYLKEGKQVQLMPGAHRVDAALEEILRRLKQGWTYIRA